MGKIIVAFLLGGFVSSGWWSLAVMPKMPNGAEWAMPTLATIPLILLVAAFIADNWDDK